MSRLLPSLASCRVVCCFALCRVLSCRPALCCVVLCCVVLGRVGSCCVVSRCVVFRGVVSDGILDHFGYHFDINVSHYFRFGFWSYRQPASEGFTRHIGGYCLVCPP